MRLPKPPWIVAHRGALPLIENTIPALLRAVDEGADLLEFDVRATADDILVLHHDADLGRLAGRPDLTIEKARLREISALELRQAERSPPTASPGRIATLDELFAALPQGFPVNIELKSGRASPANRRRLAEIALAATTGRENVLFSSFDADLLRELRRESTTARLAPIASRWTPGLAGFGQELEVVMSVHQDYKRDAPGCDVTDVTQLYLGGMSYYCKSHKPPISFPLCANGQVFGLYKIHVLVAIMLLTLMQLQHVTGQMLVITF